MELFVVCLIILFTGLVAFRLVTFALLPINYDLKHALWLVFFVLAIWLGGDVYFQPIGSAPPVGWWLVAIGFGCLWTRGLPEKSGKVADVVSEVSCGYVDGDTIADGWGSTISLRRTGPTSYG